MNLSYEKEKKHRYTSYGLYIESEMVLSELLSAKDLEWHTTDITILQGKVPRNFGGSTKLGEGNRKEILLEINDIGSYYIYDGNTVIIEPCKNSDLKLVKAFLLATVLGIVLLQKNIIAFHSGASKINGMGAIFIGNSGVGKSTLTSALREKGYGFITDEISVTGIETNKGLVVYPSYPQQRMCSDTIKKMGYNINFFKLADAHKEKYIIPVNKSFIDEAVPIGVIFEIVISDNDKVEVKEVIGSEKVAVLLRNIYQIEITNICSLTQEYFKKLIHIAKGIPLFRITRPRNKFTIDQQVEAIENTLKSIRHNREKSIV